MQGDTAKIFEKITVRFKVNLKTDGLVNQSGCFPKNCWPTMEYASSLAA